MRTPSIQTMVSKYFLQKDSPWRNGWFQFWVKKQGEPEISYYIKSKEVIKGN